MHTFIIYIYTHQDPYLLLTCIYIYIYIYIYIATLDIKISAKRIVVRRNFPAAKIAVPMLMYVRRENVTNANMMRTMLEM